MNRLEKDAIEMVINKVLDAVEDGNNFDAAIMLALLRQKVLDDEMSYYSSVCHPSTNDDERETEDVLTLRESLCGITDLMRGYTNDDEIKVSEGINQILKGESK